MATTKITTRAERAKKIASKHFLRRKFPANNTNNTSQTRENLFFAAFNGNELNLKKLNHFCLREVFARFSFRRFVWLFGGPLMDCVRFLQRKTFVCWYGCLNFKRKLKIKSFLRNKNH